VTCSRHTSFSRHNPRFTGLGPGHCGLVLRPGGVRGARRSTWSPHFLEIFPAKPAVGFGNPGHLRTKTALACNLLWSFVVGLALPFGRGRFSGLAPQGDVGRRLGWVGVHGWRELRLTVSG